MTDITHRVPRIEVGGAVVSAWWDDDGLHVQVDLDGVPDIRLVDDAVPLQIAIGENQVFPISDDDQWDWDDEL